MFSQKKTAAYVVATIITFHPHVTEASRGHAGLQINDEDPDYVHEMAVRRHILDSELKKEGSVILKIDEKEVGSSTDAPATTVLSTHVTHLDKSEDKVLSNQLGSGTSAPKWSTPQNLKEMDHLQLGPSRTKGKFEDEAASTPQSLKETDHLRFGQSRTEGKLESKHFDEARPKLTCKCKCILCENGRVLFVERTFPGVTIHPKGKRLFSTGPLRESQFAQELLVYHDKRQKVPAFDPKKGAADPIQKANSYICRSYLWQGLDGKNFEKGKTVTTNAKKVWAAEKMMKCKDKEADKEECLAHDATDYYAQSRQLQKSQGFWGLSPSEIVETTVRSYNPQAKSLSLCFECQGAKKFPAQNGISIWTGGPLLCGVAGEDVTVTCKKAPNEPIQDKSWEYTCQDRWEGLDSYDCEEKDPKTGEDLVKYQQWK